MRWMARSTFLNFHEFPNSANSFPLIAATGWCRQGFFKLREARLDIVREPGEMYLPYWLGFYGSSGSVRCRVLDAVRRRIEGAKASAFFEQWLAA